MEYSITRHATSKRILSREEVLYIEKKWGIRKGQW